jgi:hypothetical protein
VTVTPAMTLITVGWASSRPSASIRVARVDDRIDQVDNEIDGDEDQRARGDPRSARSACPGTRQRLIPRKESLPKPATSRSPEVKHCNSFTSHYFIQQTTTRSAAAPQCFSAACP